MDDAGEPYDPEVLLGQIIDKIIESYRSQFRSSSTKGDAEIDEVAAAEIAESKEKVLVGLITLSQKLI